MKPIVLMDIQSDGSIPNYQDVGWFLGMESDWQGSWVVLAKACDIVTRYGAETVMKMVILVEDSEAPKPNDTGEKV